MKQSSSIIALFLPNLCGGGAERSMVTLANGIAGRGYRVHLVLAQRKGVYFDEVSENVEVIVLNAPRTILSTPYLVRYLRRYRPFVLVSALENANLAAIWAKRFCGLPQVLIVTERSLNTILFHHHPRVELRLIPLLSRWFYRYSDWIVAVSRGVAADLVNNRIPESRIKIIYNPHDLKKIWQLAYQPVSHPWLSPKEHPVVLSVGRLSREKNFPLLLVALERLLEEHLAVRLLILGEGEDRPMLQRMIYQLGLEGRVDLPGFDPNPFKYMRHADVFVLPSRFEGLPGVLIQAAALGIPIVATDCPGGSREVLEDGEWGALVPLDDPIAMAEAIEKGLKGELPDPSPRAHDFAVEKVVEQYLSLMGL